MDKQNKTPKYQIGQKVFYSFLHHDNEEKTVKSFKMRTGDNFYTYEVIDSFGCSKHFSEDNLTENVIYHISRGDLKSMCSNETETILPSIHIFYYSENQNINHGQLCANCVKAIKNMGEN